MTNTKTRAAIEIRAVAQYVDEQSSVADNRYAFAYRITIRNVGEVSAQLMRRHWIITDAESAVQEVEGAGVVGQQPMLRPGQSFEYTSNCTIATPVGTMKGHYHMVTEDGRGFEAAVPEFVLAMPRTLH